MGRRGFSLVEIIVAAGLLALAIPLILNLLPTSFLSLRKAEAIQVATSLALYRMDEVAFLQPVTGVDLRERLKVGPRDYALTREFYQLDATRWDAVVCVECEDLAPIRVATRVLKASP